VAETIIGDSSPTLDPPVDSVSLESSSFSGPGWHAPEASGSTRSETAPMKRDDNPVSIR
jgi:hypothetical protein